MTLMVRRDEFICAATFGSSFHQYERQSNGETHTKPKTLLREPQTACEETHTENQDCNRMSENTDDDMTKGLRKLLRIDPITSRSCKMVNGKPADRGFDSRDACTMSSSHLVKAMI